MIFMFNCMMIPRENDYIHIKGEPLNTYHQRMEICFRRRIRIMFVGRHNSTRPTLCVGPFANIDEIKLLCHNW